MKSELKRFADLLGQADGVRDYLVAKRQPLAQARADDMEATTLMWLAINPAAVDELWLAAIQLYDRLRAITGSEASIVEYVSLPFETQSQVREALPVREPYWYLAADTGADFRPNTLPAAQGGELGRVIAQINDVALHIDTLVRIAPVLYGCLPYDWLIRSMLMVELAALLELTVGDPAKPNPAKRLTLLTLCHFGRPKEAAAELERMRDSVSLEARRYIRWCRDKFGAHIDQELSLYALHDHLIQLDYKGMIALAEHLLDWLDVLGATQLDLKMLVIGERRISSWPLDPNTRARTPTPAPGTIPGSLARLFRSIDSPYLTAAASSLGAPAVAGISAGRRPAPRKKVVVPQPWDRLNDRVPSRIHIRTGWLA